MDTKDYTEEMLDRQFAMVVLKSSYTRLNEKSFCRVGNKGQWGIPATFTLREARDGMPKDGYDHGGEPLSKTRCEKLRRLKPGARVQMSNDEYLSNCWFALRLDGESEASLEQTIQAKAKHLREIQAKIKKLAGHLLKEERTLQKELRLLRDQQALG